MKRNAEKIVEKKNGMMIFKKIIEVLSLGVCRLGVFACEVLTLGQEGLVVIGFI